VTTRWLVRLSIGVLMAALFMIPASLRAADAPDAAKLNAAAAALAKAQTLIEFYYMETGSYPPTIDDMLTQYNQGVKDTDPKVVVPTDPATGKKLVYTPNADATSYTVKVPEPALYGVQALELKNMDWGWMAQLAAEQRKKRLAYTCGKYQELIVGVVAQYNKDNRNKFPDTLQQLMPKYLAKLPTCPVAKKDYVYKHDDRGFEIGCPDPAAHGLEVFRFSSTEGPKKYP